MINQVLETVRERERNGKYTDWGREIWTKLLTSWSLQTKGGGRSFISRRTVFRLRIIGQVVWILVLGGRESEWVRERDRQTERDGVGAIDIEEKETYKNKQE